MERRSDWQDELLRLVESAAKDIVFDTLDKSKEEFTVSEVDSGIDDGAVYGGYIIETRNHVITVQASAWFQEGQDRYNYNEDFHYTKTVTADELQDFDYEIKEVKQIPEYDYAEEVEDEELRGGYGEDFYDD